MSSLPIAHRQIQTEEPVVGFERDGWSRYLTLEGKRAFMIGGACDTCAFVFERIASNRLSPTDVADALAAGTDLFDEDLLATVGRLLPTGDYSIVELAIQPTLTRPCADDDYFSRESLELFGMPSYSGVPDSPKIPYYRAGASILPRDAGAWPAIEGPRPRLLNPKRLFHFVVPMEPPMNLERERLDHYDRVVASGGEPAALGVSVLDVRTPAITPGDRREDAAYEQAEHWCLATYVLDGHHKIEAAARAGRSVRLLTFLARDASVASDADIDAVLDVVGSKGIAG